ncbi:polysaccharide pyruvyl transferase family protein [Anaeromassilibacillus sp. An200]|uniref:polysaccharide pyruvyl transferase family protein n=1 Tax=Anaeromassilibacillus sp. An200 TaxID=1965587 RepID=UPI000B3828E0|nr:polysaccharide pyruvyl transferase family protein [Anaeromassilibacillus sp. An200]OUP07325.1 hypothetical protein B5F35_14455 [Anaeromassilibacillus sp. An200]
MKYGVLSHFSTKNLGDDIQTYAAVKLLPKVDYVLDRENLDSFCSENGEPVAVVMNSWWMWEKWNWPPADCIYPLMISMHINNYDHYHGASPIRDEWIKGIGGDYFRAYGPVGARDQTTMKYFAEHNIDSYFSGCLTLTLPKQKKTSDAGTYICVVDLKPELEEKVREWLADTGLEVRKITHKYDARNPDTPLEEKLRKAEEVLTLYQNAKVVITERLHVTLPCLAMEVPVISVVDLQNPDNYTRWAPYSDWVHHISEENFINHNFQYDFLNPPHNPTNYLATRESLIKRVQDFVAETTGEYSIEQLKKTTYTPEEARNWQYNLMHQTLDTWLYASRDLLRELKKLKQTLQSSKNE